VASGQWPVASTEELLESAARGRIGVDRRLIQAILEQGDAAAILRFARSPRDKHAIDLDPLLIDLFRYLQPPEALEFYIDAIRRAPEDVGDELIQAFLPFGEKAVAPLLALYEELGEEQGSDVAFLLAGLRQRDPRVLSLLLERLEFDTADGAFLLGLYGDSDAHPALETMLAEIPTEEIELRREIGHALEQLDAPEPRYDPESFDIYEGYPERSLPEFDELSVEERKDLTWDPDPEIRGGAWASLREEIDDDALRNRMLRVLTDREAPVEERSGAALGLQGLAEDDEVRGAIEELYAMGGKARAKALEAMWRSLYEPFAEYFPAHLEDPDLETRRHALMGAGYFRLTAHLDRIAQCFEDPDLREDALFAYAMAMPGEISRGRVKGMLKKIDALAVLAEDEAHLVMFALDERLRMKGLKPVFGAEE
jgi:hypothetical protein